MFRYSYGHLEQNKNLTFSGVISVANYIDIEIRKRFANEVAFKDLTITLKGKNRHLMRSVTGKLSPDKVSALMDQSRAGKTTFLSALTGKAQGCTMTVEENLWFSARCRLAADLPKPEKVLVVEGVIKSLGLQPVRNSLVGTVEKMFDDLILLAKVGLTVYHGSGIIKTNTSTGLTTKQLAVRWMLPNGYYVPLDMLSTVERISTSSGESSTHGESAKVLHRKDNILPACKATVERIQDTSRRLSDFIAC
ncbi:hypothetical protein DITRI_Ditri05aG0011600 [Diplodiscus trichospermus]